MDQIRIEGLELECILGVRPPERRRKQVVRIDLALGLDLSRAGRSGRITHTADYSRIADEVALLLRFRAYRLIEVATEEISAMLLGTHPSIEAVDIRLEKPQALRGRARSASVQIRRTRSDFPSQTREQPFGSRETLLENHEALLELLHVAPNRTAILGAQGAERRVAWLASGALNDEVGAPLPDIEPQLLTVDRPARFHNHTEHTATLFCCACPESSEPKAQVQPG